MVSGLWIACRACRISARVGLLMGGAMRVERWGSGLAVRLPAALVEALGLKEGDHVEVHAASRRPLTAHDAPTARELLARLRRYRGRLPADFRFDRCDAAGRR